jgi:hypothetical protein
VAPRAQTSTPAAFEDWRMTEAVFQFKAINRRLNRQEQKAEFEEKNPPIPDTSMYGSWVAVPLVDPICVSASRKVYVAGSISNIAWSEGDGLSVWEEKI